MKNLVARFVKDESGATAIEYGLIAAGRNNEGPGMAGAFVSRPEPSLISARC